MKNLILILGTLTMLHSVNLDNVVTDSYTSSTLSNLGGTTDIVNLSGTDKDDNVVENFIIKSLPDSSSGRLVMGDAVTPLTLNQHLTIEEVYGVCFHPLSSFVGDAKFTYVAVGKGGEEGNLGTITIPVRAGNVNNLPKTDDKENSEMLNSLDAVNILDLSGRDVDGDAVNHFIIKFLPAVESGVLYMEDGTTPVGAGQLLTDEEADGLKFNPRAGFEGEALFTYVAVDDNNKEGNKAIVTIPIVSKEVVRSPITDNKKNPEMSNLLGAVNILNLSGKDANGDAINNFIIKTLPNSDAGVLYFADGTTVVKVNQTLTLEDTDGLKFDPKKNFVGDTIFTYVAVDDNGLEGNLGTVTLSIISVVNPNRPTTDGKINPEMVHTLGAVNILNLSGKDSDGNAITSFMITALPFERQGVLYMADGVTPVEINKILTIEETNGLRFDPKAGFVGDATFQYISIDNNGLKGNVAVVRIPVIAEPSCTCESYTDDVSILSNSGILLMVLFSIGLGLFFLRKEDNQF